MRVISGSARGTKLNSIDDASTRPTLDRVKESLFNIIRDRIEEESVVLDLFAGSGAIGIEFLSRGAKKVVFSDLSEKAIAMIQQNLKKTHLEKQAEVIKEDYRTVLAQMNSQKEKFDFIFIDPPYKQDLAIESVILIEELQLLKENGIIIIETDEYHRDIKEIEARSIKYKIYDVRKYGRATLIFLDWKE